MKFTKTHEWVRIEGDSAVIGITDYAQAELGDIVFVELPRVGEPLTQNSRLGTIESTKAASELYSPLTGEVIEINEALGANPELVNKEPLDKGWMVKIKMADPQEAGGFMDEAAYGEFVAKESQ